MEYERENSVTFCKNGTKDKFEFEDEIHEIEVGEDCDLKMTLKGLGGWGKINADKRTKKLYAGAFGIRNVTMTTNKQKSHISYHIFSSSLGQFIIDCKK